MASWVDIRDRLARLNAGCVYMGEPVKAIANIQSAMITGHWPMAINVKKAKPDNVIVALPLVEYERLIARAGELESPPAGETSTNE